MVATNLELRRYPELCHTTLKEFIRKLIGADAFGITGMVSCTVRACTMDSVVLGLGSAGCDCCAVRAFTMDYAVLGLGPGWSRVRCAFSTEVYAQGCH
jgi:hypothetical protein